MYSRAAFVCVLALVVGVGTYAGLTQAQAPDHPAAVASAVRGMSLDWAPDWLVKPLSRAIADANDPRERAKGTGAPRD